MTSSVVKWACPLSLVLGVCLVPGCGPGTTAGELMVEPATDVIAGRTLSVQVDVENVRKGDVLRFQWSPENRIMLVSDLGHAGLYTAPPTPGPDIITCQVFLDDTLLATRSRAINVRPSDGVESPSGEPATASEPVQDPVGEAPTGATGRPAVSISTTDLPYAPAGDRDLTCSISGTVSGLDAPQEVRVVVYCKTDIWYVQPYVEAPFTDVSSDGHWATQTHPGAQYAALLVKKDFEPKPQTGLLPSVGGSVLASTTVEGSR